MAGTKKTFKQKHSKWFHPGWASSHLSFHHQLPQETQPRTVETVAASPWPPPLRPATFSGSAAPYATSQQWNGRRPFTFWLATTWWFLPWGNLRRGTQLLKLTYCWWKKSCTSWYGKYPIIYRGFIDPRWLFGISEPSTVAPETKPKRPQKGNDRIPTIHFQVRTVSC